MLSSLETHHDLSQNQQAIGIFDSGVGGLSVLREIMRQLPHESLLYFADSAYAPYGEKPIPTVQARTHAACNWLIQQGVKALVLACNTATAHTIDQLRAHYPQIPIIGVEPGLKPAQLLSRTGMIGVLATQSTLNSPKFKHLISHLQQQNPKTHFICQAGTGLVPLIEQGLLHSPQIKTLLQQYLTPMLEQGADTLVLGCTHYPFISETIQEIVSNTGMHLIDTSAAITRHLQSQLQTHTLLAAPLINKSPQPPRLVTSTEAHHLNQMAQRLLQLNIEAHHITC